MKFLGRLLWSISIMLTPVTALQAAVLTIENRGIYSVQIDLSLVDRDNQIKSAGILTGTAPAGRMIRLDAGKNCVTTIRLSKGEGGLDVHGDITKYNVNDADASGAKQVRICNNATITLTNEPVPGVCPVRWTIQNPSIPH